MKNNRKNVLLILVCVALLGVLALLLMVAFGDAPDPQPTVPTTTATPAVTTQPTTTAPATAPTTVPTTVPLVPEIRPDTVGIYIPAADGTAARKLVTEFLAKRTAKKDIDCFEAFASTDARITGTKFVDMWKAAWDAHENGQNGKIAYILSFNLSDGSSINRMIRKPSDADSFKEYIEVYLYDDINQEPGVRYTHLSDSEITEDTILSSIKLTCGSKIDQVKDIKLSAFIYTGEDCFDADGSYIGNVIASVVIREE
jgi:hypothetical protein